MITVIVNWCVLLIELALSLTIISYIDSSANNMLARVGLYKASGLDSYIGTPIHELGHYIMAKLFGFKVTDTKFFPSNAQRNSDGSTTLGYVNFTAGNPFITDSLGYLMTGVAPMFSGSIAILVFAYWLQPNIFSALNETILNIKLNGEFMRYAKDMIVNITTIIYNNINIRSLHFWSFIIITISIARHMLISPADIKIAKMGLVQLTVLVVILSYFSFTQYYTGLAISYMSCIGGVVVGFCIVAQLLFLLYAFIRSTIKSSTRL